MHMVMHACTWSCITIATYVCHFCLGTKVPRHNAGITYDGGGGGTYVLIVAHCVFMYTHATHCVHVSFKQNREWTKRQRESNRQKQQRCEFMIDKCISTRPQLARQQSQEHKRTSTSYIPEGKNRNSIDE